jgi:putative transcriptional regulator
MKRDVFAELVEGMEELAQAREGKATLRTHTVKLADLPPLAATELIAIREKLNMSRPIFAMYLRTNARTLENWEQGRARPNAQAATLIRLVQAYPQTVQHLAALGTVAA